MKTINRVRGSAGPPTFPVSLCVPRALRHGGKPANSPWLRIGPNVRGVRGQMGEDVKSLRILPSGRRLASTPGQRAHSN